VSPKPCTIWTYALLADKAPDNTAGRRGRAVLSHAMATRLANDPGESVAIGDPPHGQAGVVDRVAACLP